MNNNIQMQNRTELAARNVFWSYGAMLITTILKFLCRSAFIYTIGTTYLGINGLYTSILNVLSLTELGIGSAMSFSLYKPVAENDVEKIKSLMQYYKRAYRIIAGIITVLGLSLVPFLKFLIKGADGVDHLILYYLLFLFNTVVTYFVSYKYSLNNAAQKNYLVTNLETATNVIMTGLQVVALFWLKSFFAYLIIQSVCLLISKILISVYLDKKYPYLKEKDIVPLDKKSKKTLYADVGSLMVHKVGDVAVNQTDNIIVSSMINISTTGLISNYMLVTSTVDSLLGVMFNNITGSLGNLCATADKNARYKVYKVYDFLSFWFYGFAAIAYVSLIQAFITLMWGVQYTLDFSVVLLIIINTYMVGQRIPLNNIKMAAGVFSPDKFISLFQAAINLVVSIVGVKLFGLIGVYIGTIVSGIIPSFIRPLKIYGLLFDKNVGEYYLRYALHLSEILLVGFLTWTITNLVMINLNIWTFALSVIITAILPNLVLLLLNCKTEEIKYLKNLVVRLFGKFCGRGKC